MTRAEEFQINTDGRTVWVNAPNCVGRFCRHSAEVVLPNGDILTRQGSGLAEWGWFDTVREQ